MFKFMAKKVDPKSADAFKPPPQILEPEGDREFAQASLGIGALGL